MAKVAKEHVGKVQIERGRWVSRQRAWQLRMKEQGLCIRCGRTRAPGSARFCREHVKAASIRIDRKAGSARAGRKKAAA